MNGSLPGLSARLAALAAVGEAEQRQRGYHHTLREICQQPETWRVTARTLASQADRLAAFVRAAGLGPGASLPASPARAAAQPQTGRGLIVLTGSGSSQYVGESLALPLQQAHGVPVQTVPSGSILTHPDAIVPADLPCLVVSFARSGDSPESGAALDLLLERRPACHHLIITCNGRGRLATTHLTDPRVLHIVLDDRTNDRSLVMTSSFTNMVLAGRLLGSLDAPERYVATVDTLARAATSLLAHDADRLAAIAAEPFASVVFLASAPRLGAAREAGLKLTEMTEGRVRTLAETFLGLRHGPMSTVHADTLVVGFLSSDPTTRAYELDLLRELERKRLGAGKLLLGAHMPAELVAPAATRSGTDTAIVEYPDAIALVDDQLVVLDVLVAQVMAFFRCLEMGLKPDDPSSDGVINRVVEEFAIHRR